MKTSNLGCGPESQPRVKCPSSISSARRRTRASRYGDAPTSRTIPGGYAPNALGQRPIGQGTFQSLILDAGYVTVGNRYEVIEDARYMTPAPSAIS